MEFTGQTLAVQATAQTLCSGERGNSNGCGSETSTGDYHDSQECVNRKYRMKPVFCTGRLATVLRQGLVMDAFAFLTAHVKAIKTKHEFSESAAHVIAF